MGTAGIPSRVPKGAARPAGGAAGIGSGLGAPAGAGWEAKPSREGGRRGSGEDGEEESVAARPLEGMPTSVFRPMIAKFGGGGVSAGDAGSGSGARFLASPSKTSRSELFFCSDVIDFSPLAL